MSLIGAKTFFFYKGKSQPSHHTVSLPDYFQKSDMKLPRSGVTLLYGHKGPGSLVGAAIRKSASENIGVCFADIKIDIGLWDANKQSLDNFDRCRFLNLPSRANRDVLDDINSRWNQWLEQSCLPRESFPRKPSSNMNLLDRLVLEEPYSHLNAIAYDAITRFGIAKFVTVFNLDAILMEEIMVIPPSTRISFVKPEAAD
ncbi:hypothetical protein [Marinobacter sp. HL-58]|uniref:hypothetical protein n=1 Tax=Marinobacter sp. HL-58 TaxID=1479237 RepID=UPI000485CE2B|nr:hypothetical protein [Marinobacter sp. HL-58]KPP97815.1 MAG: hypothetical protein HLUCCO03_09245 [Marinobacter sp. HL-58]